MGTGYTRNDTANNIADGNVINASDFDGEFDAIVSAFSTTGHSHDGTAAEGGPITKLGPAQQVTVSATAIYSSTANAVALGSTAGEFSDLYMADGSIIYLGSDQDVTLTHVADTGILLNSTRKIQFNDASQFIHGSSATVLSLGATDEIDLTATAIDVNGTIDISGNATFGGILSIPDGSATAPSITNTGDTNAGLYFSAADTLAFTAGGTAQFTMADGVIAPVADDAVDLGTSSLQFCNLYVDGTANLDVVQIDGAVTVGVDDTGYDVKFFGDTASAYMLWDTSADDLILGGGAGLIVPDGQFTLGSTAVTTTAAELNLIDGGTSRGTTAVASGDGLLVNDGGTMRMTNVDTVSTYFASHSVGGSNIVTTGALDSGSITSGFGAIDNGTSGIRTNTFTAETSILPDAVGGADLGSTSAEWGDIFIADDKAIKFGNDQDITMEYDEDGTDSLLISGGDITIADDKKLYLGTDKDVYLEYDEDDTNKLIIKGNTTFLDGTYNFDIASHDGTYGLALGGTVVTSSAAELNILDGKSFVDEDNMSSNSATAIASQQSIKSYVDSSMTSLLATDIKIGEDDQTKIDFETPDEIHFYASNVEQVYLADNIFGPQTDSYVDLGSDSVRWKDAYVDSITVTGNADIDGTANLDAVDIDGVVQIDGATTFGVDDTGVDVKLFGATSGAYLLWDESADKLLTAGGTVIDIVKDKLLIGGVAVQTTAAELNKLDGISTTSTELGYVNGVTSAIQTQLDTKAGTGKAIAMAMIFG